MGELTEVPASSSKLSAVSLAAMAGALKLVPGAEASFDDTVEALHVAPRHKWLVARWLRTLAGEGVVELDGGGCRVLAEVPRAEPRRLGEVYRRWRIPGEAAHLHEQALNHLPELLRDEIGAGDLLAPDGTVSGALAGEGLSVFSDELDVACWALVGMGLARSRPVRVVEIGGGTGRTTQALLGDLPGAAAHYRFTDGCEEIVRGARKARPEIRADVLDVNREFAAQGFADATADVVVAGHSLQHATNIGHALQRIHRLLAHGGELVFTVLCGDDPASLISTHFLYSSMPENQVPRGGELFPESRVWEAALRASGFALKGSMSSGERFSVRHHLFHAVRESL